MNNEPNDEHKDVSREDAQINGRTEGPFGSDDADADVTQMDNKNLDIVENSANGLDSVQVRGGQDGRNNRGFGGIDMDSQNGVIRMGDMDNSTMEVTDEAQKSIAGSAAQTTNTSTVDVTTSGPDDYASAGDVGVPNAEQAAKMQDDEDEGEEQDGLPGHGLGESQQQADEDIAETGTDLNNQPTY